MNLTKFQEFFLYKMVHPTVSAGWLKELKIPSRILLNEVPDTYFVSQGIKEGLYEGSGPSPMEPSFNVLTDGHISMLNFYSGNMYNEMSVMPMYSVEEIPEDEIPEGWPKTTTSAEASFMLMIKDPADIDGIKKISINGIDYDTYIIHSENDYPEFDPSTPVNMIMLIAGEDNFSPIGSEEINYMEEEVNNMKEELAEMETEDPDDPEIETIKALIFVYENWLEAIREFGDGYGGAIFGNILSLNGLSGNIPFAVHTEYEEGSEQGIMEGTLYEYVEPVYLNWSDNIRWDSNSHSYYTYIGGYGGCSPQYATFDKSGNMVVSWTDIDSDSRYIYVSNPEEAKIAARGVSDSGAVVVDPIYLDLYWPHITYQVDTNISNPGDIQIHINTTFSDYYTYPIDSLPSSQEDTPVTGYEMSYSFDGTTWTPIGVALPVWIEDGDGYWSNYDTNVYIQDCWGDNHLRLKVKYSGENGPACECIYEQKDISVAVPNPVYNGLSVRTDGAGADISINNWNTPHAGTWYKIDDGEWIKYYDGTSQLYNTPAINDSDPHTLYIQNKTDDGEHESSVLEVPVQITQKSSPVYMTFTAGEEGASITYSWVGGDSLCQYSSDHENWETWTKSYDPEPKLLEANEVLYVRNFNRMPRFNTIAGLVTVEGCLDALISPCWDIVSGYLDMNGVFQGNMDCSDITLFSYDLGKRYTGGGSTYGDLFNKNTGTKRFTNFDSIQSNVNAYDDIFSNSCLEITGNLQPGYAYYRAFANSCLTEMPVLPTLTRISNGDGYYYWPYERIFVNCSIDVVDDQGNWDFGENNFDFSQGSVLGCSSPKALAEWLGISDPNWRIYVDWADDIKSNSIDVGEPVNDSDYRDSANIYVDQIPAEGISFRHSVPEAGWLLRYDSNEEGTIVSNDSEYLLVPDGTHGRYYLRVAKIVTLNSIDTEMEGGGEIPEGIFEITQIKLYNGYGRPDTIISNTQYDMVIDNSSQSLYIYYSHESGYTVSAQYSLDGGITWSIMYGYNDRYFQTGFAFDNIPNSIDIKITVKPKEE